MRVEIRHFAGDSYTVHYSKWWSWPFMFEWGEPGSADWSFPELIQRKHVCLMDFDVAKELAESLTPEIVAKHENALDEAYKNAVHNASIRLKKNRGREFSVRR